MSKFIFVFFAVLAISASAWSFKDLFKKHKANGEVEFFLGFSSEFGLQDAAHSLLACAQTAKSSFIQDLAKVLGDLRKGKIHPAVSDFAHVLDDIHELQAECPAGAQPYVEKFGPAIFAWRNDPAAFYQSVGINLASNPVGTFQYTVKLTFDVKHKKFEKAGEDFAGLLQIALKSYLALPDVVFALQNFDQAYHLGDDTVSQNQALDFFYGFSSSFGLEDAAHKLIACGGKDLPNLVKSIQNLVKDVKKSRWNQLVVDGIAVYLQIQPLTAECSAGALPFVNEFGPAVVAFKQNQAAFMAKVGQNVRANLPSLMLSVGKMIQDFNKNDYRDAGAQFGKILHSTLNGYVKL